VAQAKIKSHGDQDDEHKPQTLLASLDDTVPGDGVDIVNIDISSQFLV